MRKPATASVRESDATERAAETIARWRLDPVWFVVNELDATPDPWQAAVLRAFPSSPRLALQACKGPGKSAVLSWIVLNFLGSRPRPKIACTSITGENLRDCLWAEIHLWGKRSAFFRHHFDFQKERVSYRLDSDNWYVSARRWAKDASPEAQEQTLAGLHADYILIVVDEVGGVPDAVVNTGEGALSTGVEAHLVVAGNPTVAEGPLFRAATVDRALWRLFEITGDPDNPNRAPRVSLQWARDQIKKWGRNSPWVQCDVFGQFPRNRAVGLVSLVDAMAAFGSFDPATEQHVPRVHDREGKELSRTGRFIGLDVARSGSNLTVATFRVGDYVERMEEWEACPIPATIAKARELAAEFKPDRIYVDEIGVGGGVVDGLLDLGLPAEGVNVSTRDDDDDKRESYLNLRAELAAHVARRFADGRIALDPSLQATTLVRETTAIRVLFTEKGQKRLEDKERFKKRVGESPDHYDSLALAFMDELSVQGVAVAGDEDLFERPGLYPAGRAILRRPEPLVQALEEETGEWVPRRVSMRLRA